MHPVPLNTAMAATVMADKSLTVPVTDTGMIGMTDTQARIQAGTMATDTTRIEAGTAAGTAAGIAAGTAAGIGIGTGTGTRTGPGVSHGIAAAGRAQVPP